jgi:hypothetical protein
MDRLKNGTYKIRGSKEEIIITDLMQPCLVDKIILNMYFSGYYFLTTKLNPNLELKVPHRMVVETEFKKSWQSIKKERKLPCKIDEELGLINVPKNADWNFDVKTYCKVMLGSGCPALTKNTNNDLYSCCYKKIKNEDYNEIIKYINEK